ncbi:MAG: hypothetical protein ACFCBU_08445 [Cyanophyceae cyanobacterium]
MITIIAGLSGAGKPTWIAQELAELARPASYVYLGADTVPIDATQIEVQLPRLALLD